jgi:hypothetical protein
MSRLFNDVKRECWIWDIRILHNTYNNQRITLDHLDVSIRKTAHHDI